MRFGNLTGQQIGFQSASGKEIVFLPASGERPADHVRLAPDAAPDSPEALCVQRMVEQGLIRAVVATDSSVGL